MALLDRFFGLYRPNAALRHADRLVERGQSARAFAPLTRAARAGNVEAQYRVGRSYLEGAGVPPSPAEAARWLERAASQGYVDAQVMLAVLYIHGVAPASASADRLGENQPAPADPPAGGDVTAGIATEAAAVASQAGNLFSGHAPGQPDFEAALRWATRSAEAGSADGQALVGYILTSGPESMRDRARAREWYARSAAARCPQGVLGYALALIPEAGDDAVRQQVGDLLRLAADAGLPTAMFLLGLITERGIGVEPDHAAAAALFRQAAEKGHRSGQARWGMALLEGVGVAANPTEGESWLRRAALAGDPEAAAWSAICTPGAVRCRRTSRRRRCGSAVPPKSATRAPPARWECCI
jgi:TPR repeat protein